MNAECGGKECCSSYVTSQLACMGEHSILSASVLAVINAAFSIVSYTCAVVAPQYSVLQLICSAESLRFGAAMLFVHSCFWYCQWD